MIIANVRYNKGIQLEDWHTGEHYAHFNLNGEYSHLTGLVGLDDKTSTCYGGGYGGNATVVFLGDDRVLQTTNVFPGDFPVEVNLDVNGVRQLTVEVSQICGSRYVDLIDMALTK
jgi:hypothetical protein